VSIRPLTPSSTRPLTPTKLRAWVRYHATKGAYCPACGIKFTDDQQWVLQFGPRVYLICEHDALVWAGGRDVIEPARVPEFLASQQWTPDGYGLVVARA
jgi:hypothetical protein